MLPASLAPDDHAVRDELFASVAQEVHEELGIALADLVPPRLLGIVRRRYGRQHCLRYG